MKKLMTVIGLALVMCLLVSFSCAAPPAPMAPAPGQYPRIIDEGIYVIPPKITDEGIYAIPPKIIDEGIFARPDDSWWWYSPIPKSYPPPARGRDMAWGDVGA